MIYVICVSRCQNKQIFNYSFKKESTIFVQCNSMDQVFSLFLIKFSYGASWFYPPCSTLGSANPEGRSWNTFTFPPPIHHLWHTKMKKQFLPRIGSVICPRHFPLHHHYYSLSLSFPIRTFLIIILFSPNIFTVSYILRRFILVPCKCLSIFLFHQPAWNPHSILNLLKIKSTALICPRYFSVYNLF